MNEREIEAQELEDERGAELGDPRRCRVHGCPTSSPDGMFDCPCPECEAEGEEGAREYRMEAQRAAADRLDALAAKLDADPGALYEVAAALDALADEYDPRF